MKFGRLVMTSCFVTMARTLTTKRESMKSMHRMVQETKGALTLLRSLSTTQTSIEH